MFKGPLAWKTVLILAVIAAAVLGAYPPQKRIALGLDLRGGAHILMQIKVGSAVKNEMDLTESRLGQGLKEANLTYAAVVPVAETALEIRGTDPARSDEVRKVIEDRVGRWEVSSVAPGTWRLSMPVDVRKYVEKTAIDTTLATMRNRVGGLGVREESIQQQGAAGDRILIQLPGVEDPTRIKGILGKPQMLEWKAVTYPAGANPDWIPPDDRQALINQFGGRLPDDTELYAQKSTLPDGTVHMLWWPLKRVSTVVGNDLRSARRSQDEWGEPAVSFELTTDAGKRFEAATRESLGKKMAIVLGGAEEKFVLSAPTIEGVIRDQGIIRGGFTLERAEDLALSLRSGAMPTDVSIIEERTVGPSLGRDSIEAGLTSGVVGMLAVMGFMLIYYRLSGVNAVVALALNVLLLLGTLGALPFLFPGAQATLTLPGIAGLILTVGMAVDSNVLVFERIREELRLGKTVRSAIDQGFSRAFMTILDCHVTTLVSCFFLFSYGTGAVKGFAVTLTIGLLISMFTAVFVSHYIFHLVLLRRPANEALSI